MLSTDVIYMSADTQNVNDRFPGEVVQPAGAEGGLEHNKVHEL